MQTTFIVEQETNNSSAQFPVDQLERYLKTAPAIRSLSFFASYFSPQPSSPLCSSVLSLKFSLKQCHRLAIWMLLISQLYIQKSSDLPEIRG